jgi:hypothetical protein
MSMKTKDNDKKSRSLRTEDLKQTTSLWSDVVSWRLAPRLLNFSIAKSSEQSENVYENKGQ